VFPVTELSGGMVKTCFIDKVKAAGFQDLFIITEDELIKYSLVGAAQWTFLLICS
jgi:hypothetical protein